MELHYVGRVDKKSRYGTYRIISDTGDIIAEIKRVFLDRETAVYTRRKYPNKIVIRESCWRVFWKLMDDEYGTYGGTTEDFKNLYSLGKKYEFDNYPGPMCVLREK